MRNRSMTPYEIYQDFMDTYSDDKTKDWLLNKPSFILTILIPYWLFCTKIGPAFMKNRPAYNLTRLIQIYNLTQVLFNATIVVVGFHRIRHYNWFCQPLDSTANNPKELGVANIGWWYCFSRMLDLLDTIFYVLRKNYRQVTNLHLYHHMLLAGMYCFLSNFIITGHLIPPFGVNVFIHVVMYIYYFIASLGPEYQKYLWWKHHLTRLQIIQFFLAFWHTFFAWLNGCDLPGILVVWVLTQSMVFFTLFMHFYIETYVKKKILLSLPLEMCKSNALSNKNSYILYEESLRKLESENSDSKASGGIENIPNEQEKKII